jgi:hypothetical protein
MDSFEKSFVGAIHVIGEEGGDLLFSALMFLLMGRATLSAIIEVDEMSPEVLCLDILNFAIRHGAKPGVLQYLIKRLLLDRPQMTIVRYIQGEATPLYYAMRHGMGPESPDYNDIKALIKQAPWNVLRTGPSGLSPFHLSLFFQYDYRIMMEIANWNNNENSRTDVWAHKFEVSDRLFERYRVEEIEEDSVIENRGRGLLDENCAFALCAISKWKEVGTMKIDCSWDYNGFTTLLKQLCHLSPATLRTLHLRIPFPMEISSNWESTQILMVFIEKVSCCLTLHLDIAVCGDIGALLSELDMENSPCGDLELNNCDVTGEEHVVGFLASKRCPRKLMLGIASCPTPIEAPQPSPSGNSITTALTTLQLTVNDDNLTWLGERFLPILLASVPIPSLLELIIDGPMIQTFSDEEEDQVQRLQRSDEAERQLQQLQLSVCSLVNNIGLTKLIWTAHTELNVNLLLDSLLRPATSILKELCISYEGYPEVDEAMEHLATILRHHNTTLEMARLNRSCLFISLPTDLIEVEEEDNFELLDQEEEEKAADLPSAKMIVNYYLQLNRFGRGRAQEPNTSLRALFQTVLEIKQRSPNTDMHKFLFGILRPSVGTWSHALSAVVAQRNTRRRQT